MLGLDAHREARGIRVGLLLCDGGCPAQEVPALLWMDKDTKEEIVVRLPDLADGMYDDEFIEVI